jgi:chromosome condensin MukBEF ATPase and DNA-binding subunit MukB
VVGATVVQSPHVEAGAGTYEVAIVTGAALHSTQAVLATGAGATGAGLDQSFHTELATGAGATGAGADQSFHTELATGAGATGAGADQSFHTELETGAGAGTVEVVQSCQWVVVVTLTGAGVVVVVVVQSCH